MYRFGYYVVSLLVLSSLVVSATGGPPAVEYMSDRFCELCNNGIAGLTDPGKAIDGGTMTCLDKALSIKDLGPGSPSCASEIAAWNNDCCAALAEGEQPTAATIVTGFGVCPICADNTVVTAPDAPLNMLYLGEATCSDYDSWGNAGLVDTQWCGSLQLFSGNQCGCTLETTSSGRTTGGDVTTLGKSDESDDSGSDDDDDGGSKPFWCIGIINLLPIIC